MVEVYNNFKAVKDCIQQLYNSEVHNVYQSASFIEKRLKYMKFQHFTKRTKYKFYKSVKEGVVRMLIGIEYNKNSNKVISTLDYYDVYYNATLDNDVLAEAFHEILLEIGKGVKPYIVFENVTEDSKLFTLLKSTNTSFEILKTTGCGRIYIKDSYEDYFNGLSKNSRQNIRTSYNRLKTDNREIRLEVFDKSTLNKKIINMQQSLYVKRYVEKNKSNKLAGLFKKIYEPISSIINSMDEMMSFVVFIDNEIAGYLTGLINKTNNSITIPRLAIDTKFSRYSPGNLLVNESIKYIHDKKLFTLFDLGIGDESYKYVMGAENYVAYNIRVNINDTNR